MPPFRAIAALTVLVLVVAGALIAPRANAMPDPGRRDARYVSIGDSYVAAGSLFTSTSVGPDCGQATDNVGRLVARTLTGVSFADWACAGADTEDITRVGSRGPQVRGLSSHTAYVSLSIGGNDENLFGGIVADCIAGTRCGAAERASALAKLRRLGPKLDRTYAAVRAAAPNAKIVVVGYLRILPDNPAGCFADITMGAGAVAFANKVQRGLNATIERSAARAGFTAVNIDQDDSHTMCAPDGRRYVSLTGIGPGDEGTPIHPTIAGRRHVAQLIVDAFTAR